MLKEEKEAKKRLRNAELAEKARDRLEKWIAENESNDAIAQSKCTLIRIPRGSSISNVRFFCSAVL